MQKNLFGDPDKIGLTINEAAENANVSTATIRNWIKTGYLEKTNRGLINPFSFDKFMTNVAGKEKLILRANKLYKDNHDHDSLSGLVKSKMNSNAGLEISENYEKSLSNSYRNKEGIYYTPVFIVQDMLKYITASTETTFLDPCCGSGNFIIEAINIGVKPENVYGFDIDPNAIEITKKRIFDLTGYDANNNIKKIDFFEKAFLISKNKRFDLIFTNPPWGKKLKKQDKEKYALLYGAGKSVDTTSLFYFASMQLLSESGKLGFLVQEALFNISAFQDVRKSIINHKILRLTDYDKSFKGLITRAQSFIIEKKKSKNIRISCENKISKHFRDQKSFIKNPKHIFNFWINEEDSKIIQHIFDLPHTTLEGQAKWALGIVTGNNSKYCINHPKQGYVPIYKGSDITPKKLREPQNYIPHDFSSFQQVAPLSMYQAPVKLIYRFISSKLVFFCDTEQRFILNSANLLIPNESISISCHQLADLLNSELMNWLFMSLFRTHKILRGDLEILPIHTNYFKKHKKFDEESYLSFIGLIKENDGTYRINK